MIWQKILYTVGCHYNGVQYQMVVHTPLHWLGQNIDKGFNSQRASYGVSLLSIFQKIDRVIMAPHCICIYLYWCHVSEKVSEIGSSLINSLPIWWIIDINVPLTVECWRCEMNAECIHVGDWKKLEWFLLLRMIFVCMLVLWMEFCHFALLFLLCASQFVKTHLPWGTWTHLPLRNMAKLQMVKFFLWKSGLFRYFVHWGPFLWVWLMRSHHCFR